MIAVVLAEVSEGGLDPRVLAVLGVLSAVNAMLRGLSPGTAGVELVFFLLILAGRVFGPGFGFVLGCTSLFASALMTAGVGPWLPFQMLVLGVGRDGRRAAAAPGHRPRRDRDAGGVRRGRGVRLRPADEPLRLAVRRSASTCPATRARWRSCPATRCWRTCSGSLVYTLLTSTGQLGHRPGDHQRGRDRGARPGGPDHAAPGAPARDASPVTGVVTGRRAGSGRRPATGAPRPSRLLVVTQSRPSGATATVRIRPYSPDEEVGGVRGPRAADVDAPQPLARAARPARGGRRGRPARRARRPSVSQTTCGSTRPSCAAAALDHRPAVVVARLDQVELVEGVLAELRGPQPVPVVEREPLHVAVAVGPDRRVGERVARGRLAVGGDPQDLAAEDVLVLREARRRRSRRSRRRGSRPGRTPAGRRRG